MRARALPRAQSPESRVWFDASGTRRRGNRHGTEAAEHTWEASQACGVMSDLPLLPAPGVLPSRF